jgi:hypothetical protein
VPDRVNLYRVQMLRSVGGNAWRMAHNPPIPARLDFMDRLGMLALDENRDYGKVSGWWWCGVLAPVRNCVDMCMFIE